MLIIALANEVVKLFKYDKKWIVDECVSILRQCRCNDCQINETRMKLESELTDSDMFAAVAEILKLCTDNNCDIVLSDSFRENVISSFMDMAYRFPDKRKNELYEKYWKDISNAELADAASHLMSALSVETPTQRQVVDALNERAKLNVFTTSAMERQLDEPMSFVSEDENKRRAEILRSSEPSDVIKLTREMDMDLMTLWEGDDEERVLGIPSDLFVAGTIPLMDFRLVVDETKDGGVINKARFKIYDDYKERLSGNEYGDEIEVGVVEITFPWRSFSLNITLAVIYGLDTLCLNFALGFNNLTEIEKTRLSASYTKRNVKDMFFTFLETWYGIQVALLHPVVREVFVDYTITRDYDPSVSVKRQNRRKVKYIKQRIIKKDALKNAIYGETKTAKGRKIKALIWYVCGHWREYRDGKRIFINPYWKGALRETKKAIDEREREIVVSEGSETIG